MKTRIDLKYALSLELTDPGCDFSVLSEFRSRLIKGGLEEVFLTTLLTVCQERGWLKERGRQRTDSTHIEAAIRNLNGTLVCRRNITGRAQRFSRRGSRLVASACPPRMV